MYGWDEFRPHYESGKWEPQTRSLLGLLSPGDLFVDVGAWIGPVTLWALERGAHVLAFEPDPIAAESFRETIGENDRVTLHEAAVGPEAGTAHIAPKPDGGYGESESRIAAIGVPVEMVRLQDVLGDVVPALVKIDIEGFETTLCPTLIPWLAERAVPVQVSLHGEHLPEEIFSGYRDVQFPASDRGDVVALP